MRYCGRINAKGKFWPWKEYIKVMGEQSFRTCEWMVEISQIYSLLVPFSFFFFSFIKRKCLISNYFSWEEIKTFANISILIAKYCVMYALWISFMEENNWMRSIHGRTDLNVINPWIFHLPLKGMPKGITDKDISQPNLHY